MNIYSHYLLFSIMYNEFFFQTNGYTLYTINNYYDSANMGFYKLTNVYNIIFLNFVQFCQIFQITVTIN